MSTEHPVYSLLEINYKSGKTKRTWVADFVVSNGKLEWISIDDLDVNLERVTYIAWGEVESVYVIEETRSKKELLDSITKK